MVKLPVHKNRIRCVYLRVSQSNLLRLIQSDIVGRPALPAVIGVIIIILYEHNTGSQLLLIHRIPGAGAHILHKILARKKRARLQLQNDISRPAVYIIHKITSRINCGNQLLQHLPAGLSDIIPVGGHDNLPVRVHSVQIRHSAFPVVLNLNLRVYTQKQASRIHFI